MLAARLNPYNLIVPVRLARRIGVSDYMIMGFGLSRVVKAKYEKGVLKLLEHVELREGEEVKVRIERSLREKLRGLIGVLGESNDEELERYLEEAWQS